MGEKPIQRVELTKFYDISLFCPYCGARVFNADAIENGGEANVPCPHTLFIAHDEGIEYRSQRFDENLGLVGIADDDIETAENGWDGLTDKVTIQDAVKIASFVPAPSFFGAYWGFAPIEPE